MRTIIPWLAACLFGVQVQAQQLTAAEYFVDTDPGVGNGTAVSITPGNTVNAEFDVDATGIPVGFHTLSTRFKDATGSWGHAVSRLFYVYGGGGASNTPAGAISAGEYFVDTDPGVGAGVTFNVSSGNTVNTAFAVDATGIAVGFHTLNIRLQDVDGRWGHALSRLFYIYGSGGAGNDPAAPIAAGEYFIDTDPGVGEAVAFNVTGGNTVNTSFAVDASAVAVGFHTLNMRFQDADGRWGHAVSRLFYVYGGSGGSSDPAAPITAAEYFFDSDPGVGNGTALPTGTPQDNVSLNTVIDASALAVGTHNLSIRFRDQDGQWGHSRTEAFVILEEGALQNDECLAASVLPLQPFGTCVETPGSTEEATSSDPNECWGGEYPDVWYTVNSGNSNQVTIDVTAISAEDIRMDVLDACGGTVSHCIYYYPYTLPTTLNTTYLLRVYGFGAAGAFGICASAAAEDCLGVVGGSTTPGTACDDGSASTNNDQYQVDCECRGWDCAGVLGGTAGPGTPCNYYTTGDGIYDANCSCTYPEDCEGVAGGTALPGTPCDDGLASSLNDTWRSDCVCIGYDCLGVAGGSTGPGSPCPNGWYPVGAVDPILNAECQCTWTDCLGVANGSAVPGSPCDDGLTSTANDTWGNACNCTGTVIDCAGVVGGTAYPDNCATCVGGTTGLTPCTADCNGVFGGTAFLDNCSTCVGGNTGLTACTTDCNGVFGGTAFIDLCGTCVGGDTGNEACPAPGNDLCGGATLIDVLANGTCPGGGAAGTTLGASRDGVANASCEANYLTLGFGPDVWYTFNADTNHTVLLNLVAGSATGLAWEMYAGACPGAANQGCGYAGTDISVPVIPGQDYRIRVASGISIGARGTFTLCLQRIARPLDCNGEQGGTAYLDNCTTCVGGNTGLLPCEADCNGVFGGTAYLDNCAECVGGNTGEEPCTSDCNGVPGGTAFIDNCGYCVGGNTGQTACVLDCNNVYGGTASIDACSVCSGGNTGITPNSTCLDCAGVPNGLSIRDACGTCLLPSDPEFETAIRTLTFTGAGNFQNAVLFPQTGEPSTTYTAEVIYTDSENGLLPLGYPRLILDYEGDGIFNGPLDRTVLMVATDASDVTTTNGKRYRATVVGLPVSTNYQTRIQVDNNGCVTQVGPFNYPDVLVAPDLEIFANDILFSDPNPDVNSPLTVYAKVHNRADYAAVGFSVSLVNEFEPGTTYPDITIPWLAARDTITISWNITTPNTVAWCPMRVTVDANNTIAETNELNNNAIRPFVNGEYNLPGTIAVYASVDPAVSIINPSAPYDSVVVSGYAYYSGTAVALLDSSVAGATVTIPGHFGESYTTVTNSQGYFRRAILAMPTPGSFELNGEVTDYTLTGDFSLSYERVLGCQIGYRVGVNIDQLMLVGDYWIHAILAEDTISGTITVTNSTCEDVLISTRLDAAQTGGLPIIGDVMVPPLAAGETFTLPFSGIQFDIPGSYSICGTSDADLQLGDLNYHNTYCQGFTVFPRLPDIQPDQYGGIGDVAICQAGNPNFVVHNNGAVPSGAFDCRVDVYQDGDFVQSYTHGIADIAPFSLTSFAIPYLPPTVGSYTFALECDVPLPDGVVAELSEANNSATYGGSANACQADLSVGFPCELPVTPVDPSFPGTVTYHAVVGNHGNAIAEGPIDVTFTVSTGGTYTTQYAGDLAPSETVQVSVTAPSVAPATASLTATVDPQNTVPEFNEGGSATDELCWEYTLAPDWDCGRAWYWPQLPVLGQTTYVGLTLLSSHLYTASDLKVRFEVSGPDIVGTALLGDVVVENAGPHCWQCGIGVSLPGSFLFSSEGTYTFTFTVDPDNEYTECNEGNNVLTREVVITNLPDLRVLSQYINPSLLNPDVNEPVTLDVTYENIGYGNLGSTFDLKVMANNDELATVANVPGLVTGGTNTVSIPVPFSSPLVGVHVFRAIIDANEEVAEGDELNNEATRAIVVGAAANLYFENFSASTNNPSLGQFMTLSGIVRNNGDLPISADVQLYYVTQGLDTIPFGVPLPMTVDSSAQVPFGSYWTVTELPRAFIARIVNGSMLEFTYSDNEARVPMGLLTVQFTNIPGCTDGPPGALTASVIGGVAPYTFVWEDNSTSATLTTVPGTYGVAVTDAEGRMTTASGTIPVSSNCDGLPCSISISDVEISPTCDPVLGTYLATLVLVYENAPATGGQIQINNGQHNMTGSPQNINLNLTPGAVGIEAFFTYEPECSVSYVPGIVLPACVQDCQGVYGGTALLDNCNVCVGGSTGLTPCVQDCHGVYGGTAVLDNCSTCVGGNTGLTACVQDCNGVWGGTAVLDNCTVCVGGNTGLIPCAQDCNGVYGGTAYLDDCDECVGGTTGDLPCVVNCANSLTVELRTDALSSQASWQILEQNSENVICQFSVPANGITAPITEVCCLPDGCYRLRVNDAGGDGFVSSGITGGYQLRDSGANGRRIIDNMGNFTTGPSSAIANTYGNGAFCLPLGNDRPIQAYCDKLDWVNDRFIVATENTAVSAQYNVTNTTSGYEFWFFDPNGGYSFRRFRNHATTDGTGTGALRAAHFRINSWVNSLATPHIPANTLLNVRVRGRVAGINQAFGPACLFKIDPVRAACPLVKLQDNPSDADFSCGVDRRFGNGNNASTKLVAQAPQFLPAGSVVSSNVRYQFRFRLPGEYPSAGSCIVRPPQTSPTIYLNWNSGDKLRCGTQYDVDVRVSKDGGATWCIAGAEPTCSASPTVWGKVCKVNVTTSTFCPGGADGGTNSLTVEGGNAEMVMYPNPNRGDQLTLSLSSVDAGVQTLSVDLYDLTGKRVMAELIPVQAGVPKFNIDLNGALSSGMYLVHIIAGDKAYSDRLVIGH